MIERIVNILKMVYLKFNWISNFYGYLLILIVLNPSDILAQKKYKLPNVVPVKADVFIEHPYLFAAISEVSNLQYKEYLYWLKSRGRMVEYTESLPDSSKWNKTPQCSTPMRDHYFKHPAFDNYPVVNIGYKNAQNYCKWLTNILNDKLKQSNSSYKKNTCTFADRNGMGRSCQRHFARKNYFPMGFG